MATTNQGWALPTVGASESTWGATLNTTIQAIDTLVGAVTAAEIAKLDGLTASTAELNILDGVTATAAELNILDGVTATTAELNILDGVTATTAELNKMDGVTSSTAELNLVDGSSAGTVVNNKAVIYGAAGQVVATTATLGSWTITETSGALSFYDSGVLKMKLDASGNLLLAGNVTAYQTF